MLHLKMIKKNPKLDKKAIFYYNTFPIYTFPKHFLPTHISEEITKNYIYAIHLFSVDWLGSLVLCNY